MLDIVKIKLSCKIYFYGTSSKDLVVIKLRRDGFNVLFIYVDLSIANSWIYKDMI